MGKAKEKVNDRGETPSGAVDEVGIREGKYPIKKPAAKPKEKRVGAPGNTEEQDATMLGYHKLPTGGYSEDGEE